MISKITSTTYKKKKKHGNHTAREKNDNLELLQKEKRLFGDIKVKLEQDMDQCNMMNGRAVYLDSE